MKNAVDQMLQLFDSNRSPHLPLSELPRMSPITRMQKLSGRSRNPSESSLRVSLLVLIASALNLIIVSFLTFFSDSVLSFFQRNMGPYSYVLPRLMTATRELNGEEKRARYVGRSVSAAPATGMGKAHQLEYQKIMNGVYGDIGAEGLGD